MKIRLFFPKSCVALPYAACVFSEAKRHYSYQIEFELAFDASTDCKI